MPGPWGWASLWDLSPSLTRALHAAGGRTRTVPLGEVLNRKHLPPGPLWVLPHGAPGQGGIDFLRRAHALFDGARARTPRLAIMLDGEGARQGHYLNALQGTRWPDLLLISSCSAEASLTQELIAEGASTVFAPLPVADSFRPRSRARRDQIRHRFGLGSGDRVMLYAGRISRQKNIDLLLRLFANLRAPRGSRGRLYLWILGATDTMTYPHLGQPGSGTYGRELGALTQELGIEDRVRFFGPRPQDELAHFFCASDLQLSLTTHFGEVFGYSIAQGMACASPTLVTAWGGGLDFVRARAAAGVRVEVIAGRPLPDLSEATEQSRLILFHNPSARTWSERASAYAEANLRESAFASRIAQALARATNRAAGKVASPFRLKPEAIRAIRHFKKTRTLYSSVRDPRYLSVLDAYRGKGIAFAALLACLTGGARVVHASQLVGCAAGSGEHRVLVEGTVTLNERFLPKESKSRERIFKDAVERQVQFLQGVVQNTPKSIKGGKVLPSPMAIALERGPTEIINRTRALYGQTLLIDGYRAGSSLDSDPYIAKARRAGATATNDPAIALKYKTTVLAAVCGKGGPPTTPARAAARLPRDPYLALWIHPAAKRVEAKYKRKIDRIPPCSTDEMAEFGDTQTYWYVWGPDQDRCITTQEWASGTVEVTLQWQPQGVQSPAVVSFPAPANEQAPLELTVIIGTLLNEPARTVPDFHRVYELARLLSGDRRQEGVDQLRGMAQEIISATDKKVEPASLQLLQFLGLLPQVFSVKGVSSRPAGPREFAAEIEGSLPKSGRGVRMKLFYGSTDTAGKKESSQIGPLLADFVRGGDIFLYTGHAGLGENIDLERIFHRLRETVSQRKKRPFWVGFFSCYPYSFHGIDSLGPATPPQSGLILSASRAGGPGLLHAAIRWFDLHLLPTKEQVANPSIFERFLGPSDFLVIQQRKR